MNYPKTGNVIVLRSGEEVWGHAYVVAYTSSMNLTLCRSIVLGGGPRLVLDEGAVEWAIKHGTLYPSEVVADTWVWDCPQSETMAWQLQVKGKEK